MSLLINFSILSLAKPPRGGTNARLTFKDFNKVLTWKDIQSILYAH
jgi:hypothetical protein